MHRTQENNALWAPANTTTFSALTFCEVVRWWWRAMVSRSGGSPAVGP